MNKISGGYYIKARRIEESEIAHAPPHVREIWDYLVRKANHKTKIFMGKTINRGELLTSYKQIQDDLSWKVGFRKKTYSKNDCETSMKWYMKRQMVHTTKTTRGFFIQIVNYDYFQNPDNYDSYNETDNAHTMIIQSTDTINKNDKNVKKNTINSIGSSTLPSDKPLRDKGNPEIDLILSTYKLKFGFKPTDKYPRRVAQNIRQMIHKLIRELQVHGKEFAFEDIVERTFKWYDEKYEMKGETLDVVKRKAVILFDSTRAKYMKGGVTA